MKAIKNTEIWFPINIGTDLVYIKEVGEDQTLVKRKGPLGDVVEMIVNVKFSDLALWHHQSRQNPLGWEFPQLTDAEINFLKGGSIYFQHEKRHKLYDAYEANFCK